VTPTEGGTIEVTLLDGDGYDLGTPTSVSIEVGFATTACTTTSTVTPPSISDRPQQLPRTGLSPRSGISLTAFVSITVGALMLAAARRRTARHG
jgi:hypothetical protein